MAQNPREGLGGSSQTIAACAKPKNLAISGATGYVAAAASGLPGVAVGSVAATGSYITAKKFEGDFWKR